MPAAGMVELDHEDGARQLPRGFAGLGLAGLVESPFPPVLGQAHSVPAPPLAIALLHRGPAHGGSARDEIGAKPIPTHPCGPSDSGRSVRKRTGRASESGPASRRINDLQASGAWHGSCSQQGMDITKPRNTRSWRRPRTLAIAAGGVLILIALVALLRMDRAAPAVAATAIWTEAALRGEMVRAARATGERPPRAMRWGSARDRAT